MSGLISVKLSGWCLLPPNHIPCWIIWSFSSWLVMVILMLAVHFSPFAIISVIAAGDSSHCSVQASWMISLPCRMSSCSSSISSCCLYRLSCIPCTLIMCHIWFPVTSMMSWSRCLAAFRTSSRCCGSTILLVLAGAIRLLRLPFLL